MDVVGQVVVRLIEARGLSVDTQSKGAAHTPTGHLYCMLRCGSNVFESKLASSGASGELLWGEEFVLLVERGVEFFDLVVLDYCHKNETCHRLPVGTSRVEFAPAMRQEGHALGLWAPLEGTTGDVRLVVTYYSMDWTPPTPSGASLHHAPLQRTVSEASGGSWDLSGSAHDKTLCRCRSLSHVMEGEAGGTTTVLSPRRCGRPIDESNRWMSPVSRELDFSESSGSVRTSSPRTLASQVAVGRSERRVSLHRKTPSVLHALMKELLLRPENATCADCGRDHPTFASANIGVFLCPACADVHRGLGDGVSDIKSVTVGNWAADEVHLMDTMGNTKANEFWMKGISDTDLEQQINQDSTLEERTRWISIKYTGSQGATARDDVEAREHKRTASVELGGTALTEWSGFLDIKLRGAKDLPSHSGKARNPLCMLRVGKQTVTSQVAEMSLNPYWDESLAICVRKLSDEQLHIIVMDQEAGGGKEGLVGEAYVQLAGLQDGKSRDLYVPLVGTPSGRIHITLHYVDMIT